MTDPEDETAAALAALRAFDQERAAEAAAERAAVPVGATEQAALALAILGERRPWRIDDRRALGLPPSVDREDWGAAVERRVRELDDAAVIDGWLDLAYHDADPRTPAVRTLVSTALTRHGDVAPFLARLDRLLRRPSRATGEVLVEAAAHTPAHPRLIQLLRTILCDPQVGRAVAEHAVLIAGAYARSSPRAAALVAERARRDRVRRRGEAEANLPPEQHTAVSSAIFAQAVRASGCAQLAATTLLELERTSDREAWAQALLAIAPAAGTQYLARMRGRPGWSALAGAAAALPDDPLDGLTSPLADVRRAALDRLAGAPRPEHLQAFLLAAELDRFVTRRLYRASWRGLTPTPWLSLLVALAQAPSKLDSLLAAAPLHPPVLLEQIAVLRADQLLERLLDAGAARAAMPVPQTLSSELRDLAERGVEAFAHLLPAPLSDDECAALEAEEAVVAAPAANPRFAPRSRPR